MYKSKTILKSDVLGGCIGNAKISLDKKGIFSGLKRGLIAEGIFKSTSVRRNDEK